MCLPVTLVQTIVFSGLALNSLLAIIPAVVLLVVIANRTAIDDRMLQGELAGYADYALKVGLRLMPGIW